MTVTLTKRSLHRTSDPGQALIYVQKQGFLCTPPQVQKTTPEQCSREQKELSSAIYACARCLLQYFPSPPLLQAFSTSPQPLGMWSVPIVTPRVNSPRQNSSTPTCLVVRMLPNLQQGPYGSVSEQCTHSRYTSSIYRAVTYHIQSIIHLK